MPLPRTEKLWLRPTEAGQVVSPGPWPPKLAKLMRRRNALQVTRQSLYFPRSREEAGPKTRSAAAIVGLVPGRKPPIRVTYPPEARMVNVADRVREVLLSLTLLPRG